MPPNVVEKTSAGPTTTTKKQPELGEEKVKVCEVSIEVKEAISIEVKEQQANGLAPVKKTLPLEKSNPTEDWTVVLPRRGKQRRNIPKIRAKEQQAQQAQQPCVPPNINTDDPYRESKLAKKMQICLNKVESSQFYSTLMDQLHTPQVSDNIFRVLGSEANMSMVIYGIGSIESYEPPRLQLSLAILMKKRFDWIGEIEVFDPVISETESRVLEALGCSVLSINEQGRREAFKPTLFFMPHCEVELYDNLLQTNWRFDMLNHIMLLGNNFDSYEHHASVFKSSRVNDMGKHILAVRKYAKMFGIKTVSDDYFRAFHDMSWHFFSLDSETDLQSIKL